MKRRWFVYSGLGVGSTILAGCTGDVGDDGTSDDSQSSGTTQSDNGTFQLLISDQPTAIDDFDSLNVSFASARVFRGDGDGLEQDDDVIDDEDDDASEDQSGADDNDDSDDAAQEDNETEEGDDENEDDDNESGQSEGYTEFDLDGETVDLTQVIGDKAVEVLDDELQEGRYSTIELRAQEVEGIVDDEEVEVTIPSERLRIVRPFEVVVDEELRFVFDINVVRRGQQDHYNLLPVIGQSGVVGRDVEVEEIDPEDDESNGKDT